MLLCAAAVRSVIQAYKRSIHIIIYFLKSGRRNTYLVYSGQNPNKGIPTPFEPFLGTVYLVPGIALRKRLPGPFCDSPTVHRTANQAAQTSTPIAGFSTRLSPISVFQLCLQMAWPIPFLPTEVRAVVDSKCRDLSTMWRLPVNIDARIDSKHLERSLCRKQNR